MSLGDDFINASEVNKQKILAKIYDNTPLVFCRNCGCLAESSSVWNSSARAWAESKGGWGAFFCLNMCGHLDKLGNPISRQ